MSYLDYAYPKLAPVTVSAPSGNDPINLYLLRGAGTLINPVIESFIVIDKTVLTIPGFQLARVVLRAAGTFGVIERVLDDNGSTATYTLQQAANSRMSADQYFASNFRGAQLGQTLINFLRNLLPLGWPGLIETRSYVDVWINFTNPLSITYLVPGSRFLPLALQTTSYQFLSPVDKSSIDESHQGIITGFFNFLNPLFTFGIPALGIWPAPVGLTGRPMGTPVSSAISIMNNARNTILTASLRMSNDTIHTNTKSFTEVKLRINQTSASIDAVGTGVLPPLINSSLVDFFNRGMVQLQVVPAPPSLVPIFPSPFSITLNLRPRNNFSIFTHRQIRLGVGAAAANWIEEIVLSIPTAPRINLHQSNYITFTGVLGPFPALGFGLMTTLQVSFNGWPIAGNINAMRTNFL